MFDSNMNFYGVQANYLKDLCELRKNVPDYRMNLIDARYMSDEKNERFTGNLRALRMLREQFDRERLKSAVACHRETWLL